MPGDLDPPIEQLTTELIQQARAIAWKFWHSAPQALDFDELVSLANKGLAEARNRWPVYCQEHGFDPGMTRYYGEYCRRRMRGSVLDYMRSLDWATRTERNRARMLRDAGQDLGKTEAELAAGTGLTRQQVADTLSVMARRPVGFDPVEHDVTDSADTESRAVVSDLLATAVRVMRGLPLESQFVVILTSYYGLTIRQAAEVLSMEQGEAAGLQQAAVLAVHQALLRATEDR